ncbi:MAG: GNAT family N-acetyltransferase, partial [Candidatus Micrarchaeaceae archaeon]
MKNNLYDTIDTDLTHKQESIQVSYSNAKSVSLTATGPVTVEKIDDAAKLESLRVSWSELLSNSEADNLFLTWEWLHTWWEHLRERHKLHVLVVRRASRLIAIAPFVVNPAQAKRLLPFRSVEFMGLSTVGTDYLDIIIRHGEEKATLDALITYLSDHRLMFELRRVKTGSTAASRLVSGLAERNWRVTSSVTEICPYIQFQGHSWESYLASLGSSHRQNMRRCLRRIDKDFTSELIQ